MDKNRKLGKRKTPEYKVFVATPAYDGKVHTDYAVSLADSCMHATNVGISVTASVMSNGAFIEMARNIFIAEFLQTDCTHLFYIDSDLKWESRAFIGLVTAGRPVCAGVYPKRQKPEEYPVHYIEDKENPGISVVEGGWVGCDRVPTGFLCIERSVIEEMTKGVDMIYIREKDYLIPWVFSTRIVDDDSGNRTFCGEDFAWSEDYKKRFDKPIFVWPDFDFSHDGFDGNWHKFMMSQIEAAEGTDNPIDLVVGE